MPGIFDTPEVTFSMLLTAAHRNELEDLDFKIKMHSKTQLIGESSISPKTETLEHLQEQLNDLKTVMKSGNFPEMLNPPAVNPKIGNPRKFKSSKDGSKKQTDVRNKLNGPEANASGPFSPDQRAGGM